MARSVDIDNVRSEDDGTLAGEVIFKSLDASFVSGNNGGGEDNGVAGLNTYMAVLAVYDFHKRGVGFSLGAG